MKPLGTLVPKAWQTGQSKLFVADGFQRLNRIGMRCLDWTPDGKIITPSAGNANVHRYRLPG